MHAENLLQVLPHPHYLLAKLRKGERIQHHETKRLTKAGELRDISLTISPLKDAAGNIIGSSKIARDITDKKQEEQRKTDFVSLISHELKTPLTTLLTYSQLLLLKSEEGKDEFTTTALRKMETQAKRMTSMIGEFLDLARLEEGKFLLRKEVFEIGSLLREVAEGASILAPHHTIVLKNDGTIYVDADKNKITHVLENLVSNAIKYSPEYSSITLSAECINDKVQIAVQDEGVGIAAKDQQKLFERFYRVENDKIKDVKGYGIGLYLVAAFLNLHGSIIKVQSEENSGSTFYFTLDIHPV